VNGGYFEQKFRTYDFLLYFVHFIDTGFCAFDRYSENMCKERTLREIIQQKVVGSNFMFNISTIHMNYILCQRLLHVQ